MGRLLKASDLQSHIGKEVSVKTLTNDEGYMINGPLNELKAYWTYAVYHSATLLAYDADKRRIKLRSRRGQVIDLHPLEVRLARIATPSFAANETHHQ